MGVANPEAGFDPDLLVGKVYTCTCESQPGPGGDTTQARTWVRFVTPADVSGINNDRQVVVNGVGQERKPSDLNEILNRINASNTAPPPPPRQGPPPRQAPAPTARRWFIDRGTGSEEIPVDEETLRQRFATDKGTEWEMVYVCPENGTEWVPLYSAIPHARNWVQKVPF
jgi:hypothetical protein